MRSHRRDFRRRQPRGPFAGLGLGDPGYRLRPGASGLDPLETYAECGRVLGILLKSALQGRFGHYPVASLAVLIALLLTFFPGFSFGVAGNLGSLFVDNPVYVLLLVVLAVLVWSSIRFMLRPTARSGERPVRRLRTRT